MQLTVWTYEGPPHVGAMRIATAMEGVHYVLHAPQGDTYADLLFTMIERRMQRPPVTYTTFQARDLGGDTASCSRTRCATPIERFRAAGDAGRRIMHRGADPGRSRWPGAARSTCRSRSLPLELPAYQKKENWGAAETFYRLVRALVPAVAPRRRSRARRAAKPRPSCNLLGPTALGFRHRDDISEITGLLEQHRRGHQCRGAAGRHAVGHCPPRRGRLQCRALSGGRFARRRRGSSETLRQPPSGPCRSASCDAAISSPRSPSWPGWIRRRHWPALRRALPWYARSVDSTYLTGKRVFVFGDATHAIAAARVATEELGFTVVGLGTYSREFAREVRASRVGAGSGSAGH